MMNIHVTTHSKTMRQYQKYPKYLEVIHIRSGIVRLSHREDGNVRYHLLENLLLCPVDVHMSPGGRQQNLSVLSSNYCASLFYTIAQRGVKRKAHQPIGGSEYAIVSICSYTG